MNPLFKQATLNLKLYDNESPGIKDSPCNKEQGTTPIGSELGCQESTPTQKKKWTMFGGVKKGFRSLANKLMGSSRGSQTSIGTEKGKENPRKSVFRKVFLLFKHLNNVSLLY